MPPVGQKAVQLVHREHGVPLQKVVEPHGAARLMISRHSGILFSIV